jgi:hypothetical protein
MLTSSEIKQSVLGLVLSDGYIDYKNRFCLTSKYSDFRNHCADLFIQFPNSDKKIWKNDYFDKRFGVYTYKMVASYPAYFDKFANWCYPDGKKELTKDVVHKIDARCLAYIWMGDGYLEHAKNRRADKIQNIGWLCLESFSFNELDYFSNFMNEKYNLTFKTVVSNTGRSRNPRVKIIGNGLQRFIDLVFPYITPTFQYKTWLFYKTDKRFDNTLSSAEHIFKYYTSIKNYEDIVQSL